MKADMDLELEAYITEHSEKEPAILAELDRATHLNVMRPRMLSGNLQGQFLKMLCEMIQARRVLEIGTYTGYAAISMAMGIPAGGMVHTIDINDELEDIVRDFVHRSGVEERICFHVGDACEVIPRLDEVFDLVFIDADKRQYLDYYRLVFDRVRPGGMIVADDVLWDGKVVDTQSRDAQTRGILEFNDFIQSDSRVENILLPVRHGLMLIRKK
ncbi:O-methyltransferase [Odoribacter lunatus]|uniref:O-methyltransferase n=1 Tax=Odoribacter lunatus TaxID=2941335 RepID=UPI0030B9D55D